ncbi:hypothetical protein COO91_01626 [Nostoc flagelliforme CCNUN1]|uniref:Uncharacterized protein n=1 Tax=Nostoc flagelliforme CCNUN1 TaxID=2038116 RepID=A0A2K8SLM5_9NOSO|nr:hypothetical protein COO91_01626 [Nostoc flagelliforme CCNUN1]
MSLSFSTPISAIFDFSFHIFEWRDNIIFIPPENQQKINN